MTKSNEIEKKKKKEEFDASYSSRIREERDDRRYIKEKREWPKGRGERGDVGLVGWVDG